MPGSNRGDIVDPEFNPRRRDGYAELSVDPDGMRALVDLHPPIADGLPLALDYVENLCARAGVVEGLDREALSDACLNANLDRKPQLAVVVAKGRPASPGLPSRFVLAPRVLAASGREAQVPAEQAESAIPEDRASRLDLRERSPFVIVAKGEELGNIEGPRESRDGVDVLGRILPAGKAAFIAWEAGEGTETLDGVVRAACAGRLVFLGTRISVDPVLRLKEGIGFHTGHVLFPGDIEVFGEVRDGFRIYSGGKASFRDTLDASDVSIHGDLLCHQGLLGRGAGLVRVGGSLQARFLESCHVAVRGDVRVGSSIMSSQVWALGRIDAGDRGHIVGGVLWAAHGLSCGALGNAAGLATIVRVGSDFAVQQRLDLAIEHQRLIGERLSRLEALAKTRPSPRLDEAIAQTRRDRDETSKVMSELLLRIDVDEEAIVEAHTEVHPGVIVEICRIRLELDSRLGKSRFSLDRAANRIVVER